MAIVLDSADGPVSLQKILLDGLVECHYLSKCFCVQSIFGFTLKCQEHILTSHGQLLVLKSGDLELSFMDRIRMGAGS